MTHLVPARFFLFALFVNATPSLAGPHPAIGKTYQLDRARYPGKIMVCTTEASMVAYVDAFSEGDESAALKMVYAIKTVADLEPMQAAGGCTAISSFSQATILKNGIEAHQATFHAFPFSPMWGYYLYFGGLAP